MRRRFWDRWNRIFQWHPLWVSRKSASGTTYNINVRPWNITLIRWTVLANIIGWGAVGVAEVIRYFD